MLAALDLQGGCEERFPDSDFYKDVIAGLSANGKSLPSKYFYDAEGSRLFEAICDLPEYYLTRTETALLAKVAARIAERIPVGATLVEFGSGASVKTRLLLDAAPQLGAYVPIDISESALTHAAASIGADYPDLRVLPVGADFTQSVLLPEMIRERPAVGFFPGSTIGNFDPATARSLLRNARALLGEEALFVLGADLVKPPDLLVPAYDDAQGVTAAFNRNLLVRINRELGANFDPQAFSHLAVWNEQESRIEMHLVSDRDQIVFIGNSSIVFAEGESIHTENSYKFTPSRLVEVAEGAGWKIDDLWVSEGPQFSIALLESDRHLGEWSQNDLE